MSLLLAIDPGASPSRPGCEARGCRSTSTTSVRAYLGRIHPTTIRVCERHRRDLEIAGDLENPVICCYPPCGRTRAPSSRLCAEHDAIIVAAKINIPRKGVISAETLVAIRKAIEAADLQRAPTTAVASARPRMEEAAPDYLGACWRHLADLVPGGTRIDMAVEQVVADLKRTRSIQRETEERRHRAETLLGDAQYLLTELGAPAGSQREDGTLDASITTRIRLLAARPGDLLRVEAIAARVAVCATHGPQATCDEDCCCQTCGQDLIVCADEHSADMLMAALREAAQPAPTVQPDPLRVQATPMDARLFAAELALDDVGAPHHDDIVERIKGLAVRVDRLKRQEAELLKGVDSIAEALNVGPPNEFDIQAGTPPGIVAQIVRSRSQALQEERARRVALAEELEALKVAALADPLAPAVKALVAWLDLPTGAALLEQMIRAVAKHTVPPEAAIRALHSEEEMARIILSTPEPFGVPF